MSEKFRAAVQDETMATILGARLTPAQRRERNKACEDIALAHVMFGTPLMKIMQAYYSSLPTGHWLLFSMEARKSFDYQLQHQLTITTHENKIAQR